MRKIIIKFNDRKQIIDIPNDIGTIVFRDDNGEDLCFFNESPNLNGQFNEGAVLVIERDGIPLYTVLFKGDRKGVIIDGQRLRNVDCHIILQHKNNKIFKDNYLTILPQDHLRIATSEEYYHFLLKMRTAGLTLNWIKEKSRYIVSNFSGGE